MLFFFYVVAICWFIVIFLDTIFKTCMFCPYLKALEACGLTVLPLFISLHIKRFNSIIHQIGNRNPRLFKIWFKLGVLTTAVIIVPSIIVCIISLYEMLKFSAHEQYESSLLLPVIPGFNIPSSHIGYYFLVFLFCSAFHEFGHALAGAREGVNLENIGVAILGICIYAFVNFRADHFSYLPRRRQLRVICAGVWHNVILTLIAILLHWLLYLICWPAFTTGTGVTVIDIKQESVFNHPGGLDIGDHLYEVGNCKFQNRESFGECLRHLAANPPAGFCVPDDPRFEEIYKVHKQKCLNLPDYRIFHTKINMHKEDICLKARDIAAYEPCSNISDCGKGRICLYPLLEKYDRFIVIKRHGNKPVLYEGPMNNILLEFDVSSYIPRLEIFSASVPETIILFLEYTIMFSSGLALLNVIPCYYLDGAFIADCFVPMALEGLVSNSKICLIIDWMKKVGFVILVTLCFAAFKVYLFSLFSHLWDN